MRSCQQINIIKVLMDVGKENHFVSCDCRYCCKEMNIKSTLMFSLMQI